MVLMFVVFFRSHAYTNSLTDRLLFLHGAVIMSHTCPLVDDLICLTLRLCGLWAKIWCDMPSCPGPTLQSRLRACNLLNLHRTHPISFLHLMLTWI